MHGMIGPRGETNDNVKSAQRKRCGRVRLGVAERCRSCRRTAVVEGTNNEQKKGKNRIEMRQGIIKQAQVLGRWCYKEQKTAIRMNSPTTHLTIRIMARYGKWAGLLGAHLDIILHSFSCPMDRCWPPTKETSSFLLGIDKILLTEERIISMIREDRCVTHENVALRSQTVT